MLIQDNVMVSTPVRNVVKSKALTNQLNEEKFDAFLSRLLREEGREQIMLRALRVRCCASLGVVLFVNKMTRFFVFIDST